MRTVKSEELDERIRAVGEFLQTALTDLQCNVRGECLRLDGTVDYAVASEHPILRGRVPEKRIRGIARSYHQRLAAQLESQWRVVQERLAETLNATLTPLVVLASTSATTPLLSGSGEIQWEALRSEMAAQGVVLEPQELHTLAHSKPCRAVLAQVELAGIKSRRNALLSLAFSLCDPETFHRLPEVKDLEASTNGFTLGPFLGGDPDLWRREYKSLKREVDSHAARVRELGTRFEEEIADAIASLRPGGWWWPRSVLSNVSPALRKRFTPAFEYLQELSRQDAEDVRVTAMLQKWRRGL